MVNAERSYTPDALANEDYISLTTFRKNGNAVPTPVWFLQHDGKIFVKTASTTGKVKRIRNNEHVTFVACNARGIVHSDAPTFNGKAQLHEQSDFTAQIDQAMTKRYGLFKRVIDFMGRFREGEYIFIEITPTPHAV
ncbi:MAG: PPOX class F420-dependent oxidoreductase [Chloroflexota bacterium]